MRHPVVVLAGERTASVGALDPVVRWAQERRARLTLVHAVCTAVPWWAALSTGLRWEDAIDDLRATGSRLICGARDAMPADVPITTRVLEGPERWRRQVLDALVPGVHDALVVVGAVPGPPSRHSDPAWLARHCPVPVWIVAGVPGPAADAAGGRAFAVEPASAPRRAFRLTGRRQVLGVPGTGR